MAPPSADGWREIRSGVAIREMYQDDKKHLGKILVVRIDPDLTLHAQTPQSEARSAIPQSAGAVTSGIPGGRQIQRVVTAAKRDGSSDDERQ